MNRSDSFQYLIRFIRFFFLFFYRYPLNFIVQIDKLIFEYYLALQDVTTTERSDRSGSKEVWETIWKGRILSFPFPVQLREEKVERVENGIRLGADKLASIGRIINCPILALFSFPPTKKPIPAERLSDFSPVDKSRRGRKSSVDLFISRLPLACRSAATDSIPGYRASKLNRRHLLTSPSSSSTFIVPSSTYLFIIYPIFIVDRYIRSPSLDYYLLLCFQDGSYYAFMPKAIRRGKFFKGSKSLPQNERRCWGKVWQGWCYRATNPDNLHPEESRR